MTFNTLETIINVLFCALVITVVFRRFKIPTLLGYFLVGIVLGPHALDLIPNMEEINSLAEFGIVFLMFTVGLEFSQPKLFALKRAVFIIGGLQVAITTVITLLGGMYVGMDILTSLVLGGIVAMSSTAIVVKQLQDQHELHSPHGLNAMGILLFQDLAVIPFIILILGLSEKTGESLTVIFFLAGLKGMIAISLIFIAGKWFLKPLFHLISKTRAIELFTLTVLLITLTAAWLTNILGLSYALGAFLAGIMLAGTEFHHQIEIEIRPFRDILLGLFFISIGMLANVTQWQASWKWIALLLFALIIGKALLITLISRFTGNNKARSLRTGLILAQGGEFGFAILTLALAHKMIPPAYNQVILAALLLSMAISPALIYFNNQIATFLLPRAAKISDRTLKYDIVKATKQLNDHIIICGFGRVGQHVAHLLEKVEVPYIGLDIDSELIQRARNFGNNVIYGNASHPGILKAAGLSKAKALVLSFDEIKAAITILSMVRQHYPALPILVRCKDQLELEQLREYGATRIIAETFEESLTISHHLLQLIEMSPRKITALIKEVRDKDYDILRKVFSGSFGTETESSLHEQLTPILLTEDAYAVNRYLREFDFQAIEMEIIAIRRGKSTPLKPRSNIKLHAHDIVIVYGPTENIEAAEKMLLEGF